MARNKPRKPAPVPVKQSPEKYIQTKARSLPVHECFINPDWQESGMATVLVSRKQPSGNIIVGVYIVDVLCLGLKITYFYFNQTARYYEEELKDLLYQGQTSEPCDYVLAHNVIYGAVAYAEDLGFKPDKDFSVTRYILAEDDESVELIELEFGRDGKPCFVAGPRDNVALVTGKLRAAVGEGNFTVVYPGGYPGNDDAFEDDDFDDDEEDEAFDDYEEVDEDDDEVRPSIHRNGYEITFDSMYDTRYTEYFEQLGERLDLLRAQTRLEPEKTIPVLEGLIQQYPGFPVLQNYLLTAYTLVGRKEEADRLAGQLFLHFPDYLLARVTYARLFLEKGNLQQVAEILGNKFELNQLYPERDVFHYTEVLQFTSVVAEFFIERGDLGKAQSYVTLMEDIEPDHPLTQRAVQKMTSSRAGGGIDMTGLLGKG